MESIIKTAKGYFIGNDLRIITAISLVVSILTVSFMNQVKLVIVSENTDFHNEVGIAEFIESIDIPTPKYAGIHDYINRIHVEPIEVVEEVEVEEPEVDEAVLLLTEYSFENVGYISANELNVRDKADIDSDSLMTLNWNSKINYSIYNDKWAVINLNDERVGFVFLKYITDTKAEGLESISISGDKRKSFMSYTKITSRSTKQYDIRTSSVTDTETGVRMKNGRYCIAVGSGFGAKVGQFVDITLENGTVLQCIISDAKKNSDTNSSHTIGNDGGVAEFIVDMSYLSDEVKNSGDLSDAKEEWNSPVVSITIYDKHV